MARTIRAGESIFLHPSDSRVIQFDWDAEALQSGVEIASSSWTITAVKQNGLTALTNDNESVLAGNRKTQTRLIATTANDGDLYKLKNAITTNESPAQIIARENPVFITTQLPPD